MYSEENDIATLEDTRRSRVKEQSSRDAELSLIQDFASEIINRLKNLSIQRVESGIDVNNLDEVCASLHNELSRVVAQLKTVSNEIKALKPFKAVEISNLKDIPTQTEVKVSNLGDIKPSDKVSVTNLSELKDSFDSLIEQIKAISFPAPVVNIPESQANITVSPTPITINERELDLEPVVRAIDNGLNKIRTNSKERPLAVRMTDGQEWVKEIAEGVERGTQTAFAAFPGAMGIRKEGGGLINPATTDDVQGGKLVPQNFDSIELSPADYPTTVTYKSKGNTVAVLTITYSGTDIASVVRS
jgi:archaellum component FlaC